MKKIILLLTVFSFTSIQADAVLGWLWQRNAGLKSERTKMKKCILNFKKEYKDFSAYQIAAQLAFTDCSRSSNPHKKKGFFTTLFSSYEEQLLNDINECAEKTYNSYKNLPKAYLQDYLALRKCTTRQ